MMNSVDIKAGAPKSDIDTPALLVDLVTLEQNLKRMSDFVVGKGVGLRPHAKLHRATPQLAQKQLEAGAIGITCAKLSEAEVLVKSGITDILIANQVVGLRKIERLISLARDSNIKVAVDSRENVESLAQAAQSQGVTIGVLVEVNIGHNRCGVAPFEPTLELAHFVLQQPGLKFMGLMGYDGHCTLKVAESEREALSRKANTLLADTGKYVENAGIKVEIVSGSGTFTYRFAAEIKGLTEIQAGTYLLMDTAFREHGVREFSCVLSVLTTVISRPSYPGAKGLTIVDAGRKSISPALGMPEVKSLSNAKVLSLSDEHGRIILENETEAPRIGDKIELWVRDANGTINQFDRFYTMRGETVEAIWEIPLCGRST
ncbi:MAG: DSD1 family PLP-dependent enzyme [Chloroflexi bacterium]|nr:DSD1 family PLP-dependent enzyme [Chloroflexota bacterium]